MKNSVRMTVITLSLVLFALVPAYAVTANIPFNFTVDGVRMPAGEYVVSSPSERVVILQHVGGPESKATITNNGTSTNIYGRSKLVFHKYGNAYFLAAVRFNGRNPTRPQRRTGRCRAGPASEEVKN